MSNGLSIGVGRWLRGSPSYCGFLEGRFVPNFTGLVSRTLAFTCFLSPCQPFCHISPAKTTISCSNPITKRGVCEILTYVFPYLDMLEANVLIITVN